MANPTNQGGPRSASQGDSRPYSTNLLRYRWTSIRFVGSAMKGCRLLHQLEAIADACDVLRSAIADVRNIIYEANALTERPEGVYG